MESISNKMNKCKHGSDNSDFANPCLSCAQELCDLQREEKKCCEKNKCCEKCFSERYNKMLTNIMGKKNRVSVASPVEAQEKCICGNFPLNCFHVCMLNKSSPLSWQQQEREAWYEEFQHIKNYCNAQDEVRDFCEDYFIARMGY